MNGLPPTNGSDYVRSVAEHAPGWIGVLDRSGTIVYQSPGILPMLGHDPLAITGRTAFELVHPDDRERARAAFEAIVRDGTAGGTLTVRLLDAAGASCVVELVWSNHLETPAIRGVVSSARDVTRRAEAEQERARRWEELASAHAAVQIELESCTAELAIVRRQMRELRDVHRRFIADASHDLRTPLTTIKGEAELLERLVVDGDARSSVETIRHEASRLDSLSTDLLLLAALDAGDHIDQVSLVRLDELLADAVGRLASEARHRDIQWDLTIDAPVVVEGDAEALARALTCVLHNAVTFSEPGGRIRIGVTFQTGRATVTVIDEGCGIADWDLPYVFDRFYRADASRTRGGRGLGLTIVKRVLETHGGSVRIESMPAVGTTVVMTLPGVEESAVEGESASALCYAAASGDLARVRTLIACGNSVNAADYDQRTPLHLAASEGHAAIVVYLLEHGAAPTARDRWGRTPIDDARRQGHGEIVRVLEERAEGGGRRED